MTEADNFIRAKDNETDDKYLGTAWTRFRDFKIEEETEHNVRVCAVWRDPGLTQSYSGEWLFKDDNSKGRYAPLREEPDLFVKFASLASKDPGTRDGRYEIMLEWIKRYGVLGLVLIQPTFDTRSERHENLFWFWTEVHRAAKCLELYEAATGPARVLKRSGLPGKTLAEKRKSAVRFLTDDVWSILKRDCYPRLYYQLHRDTGEMTGAVLSWGFRSLLGAMYLQMAWRTTSRRCEAPGCNNIIGLHERSDKLTCSPACKERRRQHRRKTAAI